MLSKRDLSPPKIGGASGKFSLKETFIDSYHNIIFTLKQAKVISTMFRLKVEITIFPFNLLSAKREST
jgi:hypothetical protein